MKTTEYKFNVIHTKRGPPTYRVYMGKTNGEAKFRQFQDVTVAQTFVKKLNRDLELKRLGYDQQFGSMLDRKSEMYLISR
jgi:hypothetical protein